MSIAFDQIIRNGILVLPEHLKDAVEGQSVHVVIERCGQETPANTLASAGGSDAGAWFKDMIGKVPPFKPLSREEANDRYLK